MTIEKRWAAHYILVYNVVYSVYICLLYILQYLKKYMYIVSNEHFFLCTMYIVQYVNYTIYLACVPFPKKRGTNLMAATK